MQATVKSCVIMVRQKGIRLKSAWRLPYSIQPRQLSLPELSLVTNSTLKLEIWCNRQAQPPLTQPSLKRMIPRRTLLSRKFSD